MNISAISATSSTGSSQPVQGPGQHKHGKHHPASITDVDLQSSSAANGATSNGLMESKLVRPFRVHVAQPADPALMLLKRALAQSENSLHAVRATAADRLRDGFCPQAGFTAFVAEDENAEAILGMATCSRRTITGWSGPVIFLQDLFVEPEHRRQRAGGAGCGLRARSRQPDRRAHRSRRQPGAGFLPAERLCASAALPDLRSGRTVADDACRA